MSSLQKFHRRTNGGVPTGKIIGSEAPVAGSGFYLGLAGDGTSYMYVEPFTDFRVAWGSYGTVRGTTSTTDGLANTNTLYGFGQAAHPTAYRCKTLTTGGYNTWYLPSEYECSVLNTNQSAVPFATSNGFVGAQHWTSTEANANNARRWFFSPSSVSGFDGLKNASVSSRAVRRSTV
jgi:hypothetical protein